MPLFAPVFWLRVLGTAWLATGEPLPPRLLLHAVDDDGNPVPGLPPLGAKGQVYPEALPLAPPAPLAEGDAPLPPMEAMRRGIFGDYGFSDLVAQPSPRLFSTHLYGDMLPAALLDPTEAGRGRLVLVLRNLKDVLASLHFFRGEAKDGWLGNEHGPGSLARFLHDDCPNAYGSAFQVVKAMDALAARL